MVHLLQTLSAPPVQILLNTRNGAPKTNGTLSQLMPKPWSIMLTTLVIHQRVPPYVVGLIA